nr:MAG TPA: hypothetical protein [Caudoviricetes sp.]
MIKKNLTKLNILDLYQFPIILVIQLNYSYLH